MKTKRVIPCLDVKDGRVVKGVHFAGFRDAGDPRELAVHYARDGADEIVLFDITATVEGRGATLDVVRQTAEAVDVPLVVGGGISDIQDMRTLFDLGVQKVSINSAAVNDPGLIRRGAEHFGSEAIIVAVDASRRRRDDGSLWWEVVIEGGRTPTGMDLVEWVRRGVSLGAGEIMLSSIDADGAKNGYDNAMNRAVSSIVPVPIIASGGVGTLHHLVDGIIQGGADAVLAASIFHFGEYSIAEAKAYMAANGIAVHQSE